MKWKSYETMLAKFAANGAATGHISYYAATQCLARETGRSWQSCRSKIRRLIRNKELHHEE